MLSNDGWFQFSVSTWPYYYLSRAAMNSSVCSHFFIFALVMTGAFSRNVGKSFSELKLVTNNLPLHLCRSNWEATEKYNSSFFATLDNTNISLHTDHLNVFWDVSLPHSQTTPRFYLSCGEKSGKIKSGSGLGMRLVSPIQLPLWKNKLVVVTLVTYQLGRQWLWEI